MEHRGMGFIAPSDGSQDLFVHRSYLADGGHSLGWQLQPMLMLVLVGSSRTIFRMYVGP